MNVILEVLQGIRAGEDIAQIYEKLRGKKLSADDKFFITLIVTYETSRSLAAEYQKGTERIINEIRRSTDRIIGEYEKGIDRVVNEYEKGTDKIVNKINNLEGHISDLTKHISELTGEVKGMRDDIGRLRADLSAYAAGTEKLIQGLLLGGYFEKKEGE